MPIRAYIVPNYLLCAECGFGLKNVNSFYHELRNRVGQAAYECVNGTCKQYGQPYIFHFQETVLDDKAPERPE